GTARRPLTKARTAGRERGGQEACTPHRRPGVEPLAGHRPGRPRLGARRLRGPDLASGDRRARLLPAGAGAERRTAARGDRRRPDSAAVTFKDMRDRRGNAGGVLPTWWG